MRYSKLILLIAAVLTLLCPDRVYAQKSNHTPAAGTVEVSCTGEGGVFYLKAEEGSPQQEYDTIRVGKGGSESFDCLFSEPGDYAYTLGQIQTDRDDVTYDRGEYKVLFQVTTDEKGVLSSSTQIKKEGGKSKYKAAVFRNTKRREGDREEKESSDNAEAKSSPKTGDRKLETTLFLLLMMAAAFGALRFVIRKRGENCEK